MVIDNPQALSLPAGAGAILRAMFSAYERVTISEELPGGFSGSRVFVVHPLRPGGLPELPTVVKLGPQSLIAQEWRAYQEFVQNRLPGVAAIQGPPHAPAGAAWAGLRYPLVGSGTFAVESLQQYYRRAGPEELRYVLEQRLFRQLGSLWRFSRSEPDFSLRDSYDYLLPVNLTLRLEPSPPSAPIHTLDAAALQRPDLAPGDYVQLHGFIVTEVEVEKAEVTLNLPGSGRSYRVRLVQVPAPKDFVVGDPREELAGRVVTTRRETLAVSAFETWGYAFDASADTFALAGGRTLPNPLARLPSVLGAKPSVRLAAIHGDLNPQNILVDPDTREVRLIDFADSRQDHVLHDLLRLETGIVTRLLPQSLQQAGLPPDIIVPLYEQLAAEPEGAVSGLAPALAKAATMLHAVRREARSYLYDPDDWTEYWHGLTLYLLGAHKYANLEATAKKLAFLGAATAQHLAAEGALHAPLAAQTEEPSPPRSPLTEEWPEWNGPHAPDLAGPASRVPSGLPWWVPAGAVFLAFTVFLAILMSRDGRLDGPTPGPVATAAVIAAATEIPVVLPSPAPSSGTPTVRPSPSRPPTALPAPAVDCTLRGAGQRFVILLDLSQSMHGEKLNSAVDGLQQLIACLDPAAEIAVYPFNDTVYPLQPSGRVADVGQELSERLRLLFADGNSALYDAVCTVKETAPGAGDPPVTFILLADGPNTASTAVPTEAGLLDCIPPDVRFYTIAYGPEADVELLARLAGRGQGTALQAGPQTIGQTLLDLPLQP